MRRVLGSVPLQNWRMGFGPLAIDWMVPRSVLERDCWTRVLRRSAGWRRTADRMPEFKPAKKWTELVCQPRGPCCLAPMLCYTSRPQTYRKTTGAFYHLTLPRSQMFKVGSCVESELAALRIIVSETKGLKLLQSNRCREKKSMTFKRHVPSAGDAGRRGTTSPHLVIFVRCTSQGHLLQPAYIQYLSPAGSTTPSITDTKAAFSR